MDRLEGKSFFTEKQPFYVNRVVEGFDTRMHEHDFIEINYVAEGTGTHYINEEKWTSQKGDLFYLPIGTSHVFRPSSTDRRKPIVVYNCLIEPDFLSGWMERLPFSDEGRLQLFHREQGWFRLRQGEWVFGPLLDEMHVQFWQRSVAFEVRVLGKILDLLGMIEQRRAGGGTSSTEHTRFAEIKQYVDASVLEPLGIADIAARFHMTSRQLNALFLQYCGMRLLAYRQSKRLEQCCALLRRSDEPVGQIAERCGYRDLKYFHKLFKERVGTSPHQYRLQQRIR